MITQFDDYMVHQNAAPVNQPASSDRNFYDRYWFNGYAPDGSFCFEAGLGLYPNRHVMDGHFSLALGGQQWAYHASRRASRERSVMEVGDLHIEVLEPMRRLRVCVTPNDTGISCDLVFEAATAPHQEPQNVLREDGRLLMDSCRFTQFGRWSGYIEIDGERTVFSRDECLGTRDKSWGVRPVGEPEPGAPGLTNAEPGVYWVWSPLFFDDACLHFNTFQDHDGHPTQVGAAILPVFDSRQAIPDGEEPGLRPVAEARHRIHWRPGTRWAEGAEIHLREPDGTTHDIALTVRQRFQMLGLGYQHPEWGHGFWQGESKVARESWALDEIDPLDYQHIHAHYVVEARRGERTGVGTLETICFGRHDPSGFRDILDGAPDK